MILSTHCRLTEIYLAIFAMMQACMEHSQPPLDKKEWTVILPQLQVGSHAVPSVQVTASTALPKSTSLMYMLLVVMILSQLCEGIARVMGLNDQPDSRATEESNRQERGSADWDRFTVSPAPCQVFSAATDRQSQLEKSLESTRQSLQRVSLAVGQEPGRRGCLP